MLGEYFPVSAGANGPKICTPAHRDTNVDAPLDPLERKELKSVSGPDPDANDEERQDEVAEAELEFKLSQVRDKRAGKGCSQETMQLQIKLLKLMCGK
jgi:hypothetical protein